MDRRSRWRWAAIGASVEVVASARRVVVGPLCEWAWVDTGTEHPPRRHGSVPFDVDHFDDLRRVNPIDTHLETEITSPNRPGIGRSDFYQASSTLDWAGDVAKLMCHLDVERFSVVGVSAGTPYALACGLLLSERVDRVGVIAGIVPPELYEDDDLVALVAANRDGARRVIDEHVKRVAADIPAYIQSLAARPDPDGPIYGQPSIQAALTDACREAYRRGSRGVAQDILLINSPWGFSLAELQVPCL